MKTMEIYKNKYCTVFLSFVIEKLRDRIVWTNNNITDDNTIIFYIFMTFMYYNSIV